MMKRRVGMKSVFADVDGWLARHAGQAKQVIGKEVACRRGCSDCCHNDVSIMMSEALAIADAIRQLPRRQRRALWRRVSKLTIARRKLGKLDDPMLRYRSKLACPLLVDGECVVYAARPLQCRAYMSCDMASCHEAFSRGGVPETLLSAQLAVSAMQGSLKGAWRFHDLGEMLFSMASGDSDFATSATGGNACGRRAST